MEEPWVLARRIKKPRCYQPMVVEYDTNLRGVTFSPALSLMGFRLSSPSLRNTATSLILERTSTAHSIGPEIGFEIIVLDRTTELILN